MGRNSQIVSGLITFRGLHEDAPEYADDLHYPYNMMIRASFSGVFLLYFLVVLMPEYVDSERDAIQINILLLLLL